MIGQPFPNEKPVEHLQPGHLYLCPTGLVNMALADKELELVMYIKRGAGGNGPKRLIFRRLANDWTAPMGSDLIYKEKINCAIREVPLSDLPLYVSYHNHYPMFERLLKK